MDRETIIKLAREVYGENAKWEGETMARLERLVNLVAEHVTKSAPDYKMGYADGVAVEREQCAKVAEQIGQYQNQHGIAAAIRARGNT